MPGENKYVCRIYLVVAKLNPTMYIERNVFRLRFGAGKTAITLWQAFLADYRADHPDARVRLLTDLTGPAYMLVLELAYPTYAELEPALCPLTRHAKWKDFYAEFSALCEQSERTLFREL
jgi:hypothetical protein